MTQRPYNPSQGAPGGPTGGVPRPAPHAPFNPTADTATYRDLLLFEERLKMNAEMLARRRRRYNAFLWSFVGALAWLLHRWLFIPSHASIAVVVITLVLFFASGMYEEKIRYAHSYITHSNKALRPLNMHLNLRRPPATFPIPFLRSRVTIPTPSLSGTAPAKPVPTRRQSTTSTVMASIPPSHNPRGELIFSSRVDKTFREGYERYRAAFERRREEKAREEARRNARWFPRTASTATPTLTTPTPPASRRGTPPPSLGAAGGEKVLSEMRRGRTPSPGLGGSRLRNSVDLSGVNLTGTGNGNAGGNGNGGGSGSGSEKGYGSGKEGKRERAESYSFVWSDGGPKRAP